MSRASKGYQLRWHGKTWQVRGTYLGVYLEKSTGTPDKRLARAFLAKCKDEVERGHVTPKGQVDENKPETVKWSDAVADYIRDSGDDRFLERIADAMNGDDKPLGQITQKFIDDLAHKIYPGATPATRNRQVHTPISAVLKRAGIERAVKRPKGWRGKPRTVFLFPKEAFAVFDAADAKDAEFGLFLRTLLYTGMRLGDGLGSQCVNLSLDDAVLQLSTTKNGEPRAVHLPPHLVERMRAHPRGLDRKGKLFKFRKCGRLYTWLDEVRTASGVAKLGFHVLCHTYATWLGEYAGLTTEDLVETGRWKDPASARRYKHTSVSKQARRADLLPVEPMPSKKVAGGEVVDLAQQSGHNPGTGRLRVVK